MNLVIKKNKCSVFMGFGINGIFSGTYLCAFISGALKIASGTISYGTMTAFLSLVNQIQTPVLSLTHVFLQVIGVLASGVRVMEIADMTPEDRGAELSVMNEGVRTVEQPMAGESVRTAEKSAVNSSVGIAARNVTFSYTAEQPIISNLSFEIQPGSLTTIMGHSGIGKTTLIRMLLGFLPSSEGELVYRDSHGQEACCSASARNLISYVPQGNTLFSGTIAQNLPMGLHTSIEERAHGLSEGQAQRIAIARAFLCPAPVLILDEATSSLDEETEKLILENHRERNSGQTCVVVSHRSTIRGYADQVICL